MIQILAAGLSDAGVLSAEPAMELGRGAIAGAFIIGAAFLAGYAAIRRSGLAVCALLMVAAAAALEFSWLGFFAAMPAELTVMVQGVFAAAAIIFLSASVGAARYNPILGGVLFTAALIIGGMGLINFFDRIDVAPLMRLAVLGVGGFAVILAVTQALRGDTGARLILPGVALAAAAPLFGPLAGIEAAGFSLAPHALLTIGVLAASIVALTEGSAPRSAGAAVGFEPAHDFSGHDHAARDRRSASHDELDLHSQLARVLDYSGVAVWDWSGDAVEQTDSLPELLGADSSAPFTPEALREFIHKDDAKRFEKEVLAPVDGPFDTSLKLFDGRKIRLRGARAAHEGSGQLERLVAFIENAGAAAPLLDNGVDGVKLQRATEAAIVPAVTAPAVSRFVEAFDKGDIVAAFQPVVGLDNKKIVGYEALARWRDQEDGADEGPEIFVQYAAAAGKADALAQTMLREAASFLAEKIKSEKRRDLFVAMNVSWAQMSADGFADDVRDVVKEFGLPKNALVLELTEGDAVSDDGGASKIFRNLKGAGASLAFDDFGAGFSCLSNLRKYDFDYLKIDKSFAADLEKGGDGAKIVRALASLGKDLGLKVIVEGVETNAAAKAASQAGCAYGQGYALGKPVEMSAKADVKTEAKAEKKKWGKKAEEEAKADLAAEEPEEAVENPDEVALSDDEKIVDPNVADLALAEEATSSEMAEGTPERRPMRWKSWR